MKRPVCVVWIAFILSWSCLVAPASASRPGLPSGFKTLRWGDPPLFYMDRLDRRDGLDVYFLPGEADRYAGIATADIRYLYRDGGLCRVEVDWRKALGLREYKSLVESLTREWGQPDESAGPGSLVWRSESEQTEATLLAVDSDATPWTDYDTAMVVQSSSCE